MDTGDGGDWVAMGTAALNKACLQTAHSTIAVGNPRSDAGECVFTRR